MWVTDLLRPLWRAAIAECIASKVMHLDATELPVLDRGAPGGKRLGALWGYVGDDVAAYIYVSTGRAKGQKAGEMGPEDILALREGPTVADASNVFDASFQRNPKLIEYGCNMHARRYYVKALDAGDQRAALPLAAYKKLYEIEEEIRDRDPDTRLAVRQAQSKPVFGELAAWAKIHQPHEPPTSKLGEAIRYLLNHRVALGRFLDSSIAPIDNGAVERLHISTALTRKHYLFTESDAGGDRATIAYAILECYRISGINSIEYLSDVLPIFACRIRLIDLPDFLPARWQAPDCGGYLRGLIGAPVTAPGHGSVGYSRCERSSPDGRYRRRTHKDLMVAASKATPALWFIGERTHGRVFADVAHTQHG